MATVAEGRPYTEHERQAHYEVSRIHEATKAADAAIDNAKPGALRAAADLIAVHGHSLGELAERIEGEQ